MHFWIDKRSQRLQGCGFSGRHIIPPSISGYGLNYRLRCGDFYPKPMVTPVHRFQSIQPYRSLNRFSVISVQSPSNGSTTNVRNTHSNRSREVFNNGEHTLTIQRSRTSTAKFKCIWVFFAVVIFLAGAKFYLYGASTGNETLTFCTLFMILLICGGTMYICQFKSFRLAGHADTQDRSQSQNASQQDVAQPDGEETVPNNIDAQASSELPPPPYHIAVMLPSQETDTVQIIRDSPPPSYEKAIV